VTLQEATSLHKALRGHKLLKEEWFALRHLRDKLQPNHSERFEVQLCNISGQWVSTHLTNHFDEAYERAQRHEDPRMGIRIWDAKDLKYRWGRKGSLWDTQDWEVEAFKDIYSVS